MLHKYFYQWKRRKFWDGSDEKMRRMWLERGIVVIGLPRFTRYFKMHYYSFIVWYHFYHLSIILITLCIAILVPISLWTNEMRSVSYIWIQLCFGLKFNNFYTLWSCFSIFFPTITYLPTKSWMKTSEKCMFNVWNLGWISHS